MKKNEYKCILRILVTFADFLGANYRFKQLIEFIQLFFLVSLLAVLFRVSLSNLQKSQIKYIHSPGLCVAYSHLVIKKHLSQKM